MNRPLLPDVSVDGVVIPAAAIAAEAQNHPAPPGKPGVAWRSAARALAVRALLLAEATRRGIAAEPEEVGPGRVETGDEARIRALLDDAVRVEPPSESEVLAEWERAPDRFRAPPLWEASHILCACEPGDHPAAEAARARADALGEALAAAPRDFARIAAAGSDCGSKSNGGALGQLGPGDAAPEFEAVLRSLAEGATTPSPVRTRFGWHIVRLDACAEGQVLPYDAVRPRIAEAMEKARWAEAARRYVDGLVAGAEITGADLRAH